MRVVLLKEDHLNEIRKVLDIYIEGSRRLDYDQMISVVHPDARLYYGGMERSKILYEHWKGTPAHLRDINPDDYYKKTAIEVCFIESEETIAFAKVIYHTYFDYKYIDYHSLIKIQNNWKIIDKVSYLLESPEQGKAETNEIELHEVLAAFKVYLESVQKLDFELMRSLAHPEGRIYIGGELPSKNLIVHWKEDQERTKNLDRETWAKKIKITPLSIRVDGLIAHFKLQFGSSWLDYHTLVKYDGSWKLVNKVSHRIK